MQPFGMNESKFQTAVKTEGAFKFTVKYQMDSIDRWTCSDGRTGQMTLRTVQSRPLNVTNVFNTSANKVTGFTLNGIDQAKGGTFLYGERIGYDKMYQCPGGYFTGLAPHLFENTVLPGVSVNYGGTPYELPNTPVEVAPVA